MRRTRNVDYTGGGYSIYCYDSATVSVREEISKFLTGNYKVIEHKDSLGSSSLKATLDMLVSEMLTFAGN